MRRSTDLPLALLVAAALAGCGASDLGKTDVTYSKEDNLKKVENDPNIPADAKARMKAAFETGGGRGTPATGVR